MTTHIVHIIVKRKDKPYQHQHFDEEVRHHVYFPMRVRDMVLQRWRTKQMCVLPLDFDYDAHDITIGAAIQQ